jgi:hypothetical protein
MPANTTPIFPLTPKVSFGKVLTANTNYDGTGTAGQKAIIFTAGSNGARIDQVRARALGTNITTALRIFVNNGSDNTVATNNTLVQEATISATTASQVAALADNLLTVTVGSDTVPAVLYLPAGFTIIASVGTTIASGIQVTVHAGDY